MCGYLILEVSKPVDAKQVKLLCSGVTYFYIGAEEFKIDHVEDEKQLWVKAENSKDCQNRESNSDKDKEKNGKDDSAENNETSQLNETEETLIINENGPASSTYIPVGKHRFPFSFKLPEACPASVPNIASGLFTYICVNYRLKALIER